MVVLLGFCGFAVDISNWWLQAQRQQRAADAAALAGVVFMPDSYSNAEAVALSTASQNGYPSGSVGVSTTGRPTQLRVQVERSVRNFFGSILGVNTTRIRRSAVAEYQGSVPMGSPERYLGQDPDRNHLQRLWVNIAGKAANKQSGDRYTANGCGASAYLCGGGGNQEYLKDVDPATGNRTNEGYFFAIRVTSPGDLNVQIYDPAYISTGDTCTSNMPDAATAATYVGPEFGDNPGQRYAGGNTIYCTGDQDLNVGSGRPDTAYLVRAPDLTPWTELDNPVINTASCRPQNFRPVSANLATLLPATNTSPDAVYVREVFHRWVTVCSIPNAPVGDYYLQVRTNHRPSNPANRNIPVSEAVRYDPTVNTGGHNRFSIRVDGGTVGVFGSGRLPIYVNSNATTTPTFHLARVTPGGAQGRNLKLQFFDIGDVGNGSVTMRVIPPPDSNIGSNFSGCSYRVNGVSQGTTSTCTLANMSGGSYQGGLVDVTIPIPNNYSCSYQTATGCWVKVQMSFNSGATPTDTTTWTAAIDGDPVRLVE